MSKKFDSFIECLELLCRQHGVQIAESSCGGLGIWDLQEGEPTLWVNGVEDCTVSVEGQTNAWEEN